MKISNLFWACLFLAFVIWIISAGGCAPDNINRPPGEATFSYNISGSTVSYTSATVLKQPENMYWKTRYHFTATDNGNNAAVIDILCDNITTGTYYSRFSMNGSNPVIYYGGGIYSSVDSTTDVLTVNVVYADGKLSGTFSGTLRLNGVQKQVTAGVFNNLSIQQ